MAITKKIIVLANSAREEHRCVAGKELIEDGNGFKVGSWIRLSEAATKGGAVRLNTTQIERHGVVRPLQVIKVTVDANCGDLNHPEDWWLTPGRPWKFMGQYNHDILPSLVDPITSLWHEGTLNHRVTTGYVQRMGESALSLGLIRAPENWRFEFWNEAGTDGKKKSHRDLKFEFGGGSHQFSVTDPDFMQPQCQLLDVSGHDNVFFCLSLTPEWNGYHYKVCATIFEP